ncbi:Bax protein [Sinobacterium caligoides]|uniref:Bax protein n=1 Tax=Sinobacterium caligoides TaxID=933926 RepID=A0A3N2DY51_9GAMM|nr:glucosaminidase domain-containing protein [Sinobacterium caligoides]ROS04763.1 Bax protein [Sinobacterium caligoides]
MRRKTQPITIIYVAAILLAATKVVLLQGPTHSNNGTDAEAKGGLSTLAGVKLPATKLLDTPEFSEIKGVTARKKAFFGYLGEYIESENQHILAEREQLLTLQEIASKGGLNSNQKAVLRGLATRYKLLHLIDDDDELIKRLRNRIDIIPPSLALSQSANESAWGTSRFAKQGNNFFGQWCFRQGCGIVPQSRPVGEIYEVAAFEDTGGSVRAYFLNLNTHKAYKSLRDIRSKLRAENKSLSGAELAVGLGSYSARGAHYVDEIQRMIVFNNLDELDGGG